MLNAVIDIGSTSVRLIITDGARVQKKVNTTRLAENMGEGNYLQPINIERTAQAVAEYCFEAMQADAQKVFAFATEAVRSARNRHKLVARIFELCGLEVDILSKQNEAMLGFEGAYQGGRCAVVDMGGASTELTVGDENGILYAKSIPYGIVRLAAVEKTQTNMVDYINERLALYGEIPPFDKLIAIGGTITTMAAMLGEMRVYDPNAVNGAVISAEVIKGLYERVAPLPVEKRRLLPGLPEKRADIIAPGILMYDLIMKYLGVNSLTVSEGDNAEGYLIKRGVLPQGFKAKYEKIL